MGGRMKGESVSMESFKNIEDRDRVEAEVLGTLTAGFVNLETPLPTCLHYAKKN